MFTMNAANTEFVNSKNNPVQPWFKRIIDQLAFNAHKDGLNFNDIDIHIVIHSDLWQCIARLYAYDSYTKLSMDDEGVPTGGIETSYFVTYDELCRDRHEEYLDQLALPIGGRMFPVTFDDDISDDCIYFYCFYSCGQDLDELSGCIKNVNCNHDNL